MMNLELRGARQNNLQKIDLDITLGQFLVLCGPSGSGKSTLAFETLYAEGQRRYFESLSNYSKQFLQKAPKPLADRISNIPPAIAIQQKNSIKSSRSTVGTLTELLDDLRDLFATQGQSHCPDHMDQILKASSPSLVIEELLKNKLDQKTSILIPIEINKKEAKQTLIKLQQDGLDRFLILKTSKISKAKTDKSQLTEQKLEEVPDSLDLLELQDHFKKSKSAKSFIYAVLDRIIITEDSESRLYESLSQAFSLSQSYSSEYSAKLSLLFQNKTLKSFYKDAVCPICLHKEAKLTRIHLNKNSPIGACTDCNGFGNILSLDEHKIIPQPHLSLSEDCIQSFSTPSTKSEKRKLLKFCELQKIPLDTPWFKLKPDQQKLLWSGNSKFYGINGFFNYLETKKYKMHIRILLNRYKSSYPCDSCRGSGLKKAAFYHLIKNKSLPDLCQFNINQLNIFLTNHFEVSSDVQNTKDTVKQKLRKLTDLESRILNKLEYLKKVGLSYLSLNRASKSLSGGEIQRLMLANQLGSGLSQTLFILDEPTVGLHPVDTQKLIAILKDLNKKGNTVLVVEHDEEVIKSSQRVLEMGPGSGIAGGNILFNQPTKEFIKNKKSPTAQFMNTPEKNRLLPSDFNKAKNYLELKGCTGNNLQNCDLKIPLNQFVSVCGLSGSGKTSLISNTLYPALLKKLQLENPGKKPTDKKTNTIAQALTFKSLTGHSHLEEVVFLNQYGINGNKRTTLLHYLKIFDPIRKLLAQSTEAKLAQLTPTNFSLHSDNGFRCKTCKGLGTETIEMLFMDDLVFPCENCKESRFEKEIHNYTYKSSSNNTEQNYDLVQIFNLTVKEALSVFKNERAIKKTLLLLDKVGLSYLKLGHGVKKLSGGESQRLRLAAEMQKSKFSKTLYIFDEPSTGLHFGEIKKLIQIFQELVQGGASLIVIEHHIDILAQSDHIIELGPESGPGGGQILFAGRPQKLITKKTPTSGFLKPYYN